MNSKSPKIDTLTRCNKPTPRRSAETVQVQKKTVSIASVFKSQPKGASRVAVPVRATSKKTKKISDHASVEQTLGPRSKGNPCSPLEAEAKAKVSKRRPETHKLAVAFTDTSNDYRRYLYQSTSSKIYKTLETLIGGLHDNALQTVSSDNNSQESSPFKLSIAAKLEREANKIYTPISKYQIRMTRTNTSGERQPIINTLEKRMFDYDEYVVRKKAEVEKLGKDWETVVGEIWKLGVRVLGTDALEALLFVNQSNLSLTSPSETAESTLFVQEQDTSPSGSRKTQNKKHVTFKVSDQNDKENASDGLAFLYQPSRLRKEPVAVVPTMPAHIIEDLRTEVGELGRKYVEELGKAEEKHHAFWKRKTEKFAEVMHED